jgi:hypothetical protein
LPGFIVMLTVPSIDLRAGGSSEAWMTGPGPVIVIRGDVQQSPGRYGPELARLPAAHQPWSPMRVDATLAALASRGLPTLSTAP